MAGTLFQTNIAKGFRTAPRGLQAGGDMVARGLYKFVADFEQSTDKVELLVLPPFCRIVDMILVAEVEVQVEAPADTFTDATGKIGFLSGDAGSNDNARTLGSEFFVTTNLTGAVTRMTKVTGFQQGSVDYARGIGFAVDLTDADIPADLTGATRVELIMTYTPDY